MPSPPIPVTARRILLVLIDALLLALAWLVAYSLRFEFSIPADALGWNYAGQMKALALPVVATHIALLWAFRLYQGMLRYTGLSELRAMALAGISQAALWGLLNLAIEAQSGLALLPLNPDTNATARVPWSVLVIYSLLAVMFTGGFRISRRLWLEGLRGTADRDLPRTLVVGAGDAAHGLIAAVRRDADPDFQIVAAVAEDPRCVGLSIGGVPVRGALAQLGGLLTELRPEEVLIAMEDATPARLREVIRACETAQVRIRTVPTLDDIAGNRVEVSRLRRIGVEDLLGREPRSTAIERAYLAGETVLVTGAGGSIGSELCRQVARQNPARLVLLGKGENSLFEIEQELRRTHPALTIDVAVGDVRDGAAMQRLFARHPPAFVFHAAAHKHVPLMEAQPGEAVRNNTIGTATLALMAERHGTRRFILVSTDKAVRPTSVMGATKRLAEVAIFALAREARATRFAAVRFGNVLGSRGSVIRTFQRQIEAGGPVTVTHPDATRYFMTIPEAVYLVLQAGAREDNGRLYLLDMGEPVRIADLAKSMIALAGLRPEADIRIEYTGLRPGEKIREELLTSEEGAAATDVPKLLSAEPRSVPPWRDMVKALERLDALAEEGDDLALLRAMRDLVPDFHPRALDDAPAVPPAPAPAPEPKAEEVEAPVLQADLFEEVEPAAPAPDGTATNPGPDPAPFGDMQDAPKPEEDPVTQAAPAAETAHDDADAPRGPMVVIVDAAEGAEALAREAVAHWRGQLAPGDTLLLRGSGPAPEWLGDAAWMDRTGRPAGAALAEAFGRAGEHGEFALIAAPGVRMRPGALNQLTELVRALPDSVMAYSDYDERIGEALRRVTLLDHEGCIHERFDFGGLRLYHLPAVRRAGGVRADLWHAHEYDLNLRLLELGRFVRLALPAYELVLPAAGGAPLSSALRSPGLGPLGGFSYLFYPPEVESEVTAVFEDMLRRRGAWLGEDYEPRPEPAEAPAVRCSVVIPVRNREKYIAASIESVLGGTEKSVEVIVVDNGSTDGTRERVDAIAARDPRVRVLAGEGDTIAAALNQGIRAARGRYICQLDSDDFYAARTLERMADALDADPLAGLAISYYRLVREDGTPIEDVAPVTHAGHTRNQVLRRDGAGATRVFPKAVMEEMGLYDERFGTFGEDYDMVLKVSERHKVLRVHEVLYFYRRHDDNSDVTRDPVMKFRNKNTARLEALERRRAQNALRARQAAPAEGSVQ
jgi:FlaA1/EpsC-like NDP-sugar epimerase/GT2 family glycosyltransferase